MENKKIHLAEPRGFCSGVKAAIEIVEKALEEGPLPVCVLHEIVHNEHVVAKLAERGVRFVEEAEDAPPGSTLVFSAHGVSEAVEKQARALPLRVVDATCPLVKRLHRKAAELEASGHAIILIGHKGHNETVGALGRLKKPAHVILNAEDVAKLPEIPGSCACLTQTTLSADDAAKTVAELKKRFPRIVEGGGVCYATKDRQNAVKKLAGLCDAIIVIGSKRSSNSMRLKEVAEAAGAASLLVGAASEIPEGFLGSAKSIGVTAGASAPESLVAEALALLEAKGFKQA